jgi:hypothetical protein
MPRIINSDKYTTVMILPNIQSELRRVNTELKKTRKGWSVTKLFNLACLEFLTRIGQMNDKAIEDLFDKYEHLKLEDEKQ